MSPPRPPRMTRRTVASLGVLFALLAVTLGVTVTAAVRTQSAQAAGTIAYPDLISVIPTEDFAITHPTPSTKEFDYEHIVFNAGQGPLDILPSYDPATNTATGSQRLYSYNASGSPVLEQQVPVQDQFFYHALHGHFHFPLAAFGLFGVNPDGTMGSPVALSPKNGFCIGDSVQLDPTLPHSPSTKVYVGYNLHRPDRGARHRSGLGRPVQPRRPGPGHRHHRGARRHLLVPQLVVDPANNFVESDKSNNVTDVKVRISGDTVTPLTSTVSQGSFVIDKSFIDNGPGPRLDPGVRHRGPQRAPGGAGVGPGRRQPADGHRLGRWPHLDPGPAHQHPGRHVRGVDGAGHQPRCRTSWSRSTTSTSRLRPVPDRATPSRGRPAWAPPRGQRRQRRVRRWT